MSHGPGNTLTLLAAVAAATLALGAGCGKDDCEKLYDKMVECEAGKGEKPPKSAFVSMCKAAKSAKDAELSQLLTCAGKSGCDAFKSCQEEARLTRQRGELMEKVAEAKKSGKWDDALDECQFSKDLLEKDAEAKKACDEVFSSAITSMMEKVTQIRDKGEDDGFSECMDLERVAKALGGDHEAKAKILCKEADVSKDIAKAIAEAKANAAAKKSDLPIGCSMTVDSLKELDTEWVKGKRQELLAACYIELGKVVMETELKDMKYGCDYTVQQVYDAVKAHSLKDPDMDKYMEQAAAKCEKKK